MASAFKCDACGMFFELEFDSDTNTLLYPNVIALFGIDTMQHPRSYLTFHMPSYECFYNAVNKKDKIDGDNPVHFDLCPTCMDRVVHFICKNHAENDEKIE